MKNNHRDSKKSRENKQKLKFWIIMQDQWAEKYVLDMSTQWEDAVKQ